MSLQITVKSGLSRAGVVIVALAISIALLFGCGWYLILGTLTDDRIDLPQPLLIAWLARLSNSPRLLARIAADEMQGADRDLNRAEAHIRSAIELLPGEYNYRILLGSILEAQGDGERAEQSYREALRLAPNYIETHWRLANNLVRQGKVQESLEHFQYATGRNLGLLPNAFDLIWNVTGGDEGAIAAITSGSAKAQLTEADFLVRQGRYVSAADIYRKVDRARRRTETESAGFINDLVNAQQSPLARELWADTLTNDPSKPGPIIWNGGFEGEISTDMGQFDWKFRDNVYARVVIDTQAGKSGQNSLRLTFLGKDTARITDEIGQVIVLRPGKKYQVECWYKTRDFSTPAGPQVAVWDASGVQLGVSGPVPEGSGDWRSLVFTVTATTPMATLRIQRIPKASYDDPSRGVVWFDDFTIREL